jgi:hypothetical protein
MTEDGNDRGRCPQWNRSGPRALLAAVLITAVGCAEVPAPVARDPAGPCLQLVTRRVDHSTQATLWRGGALAGNGWLGTSALEAPLIAATGDNPAAAEEARRWQRARADARRLALLVPAALVAFVATAAVASHESRLERAEIGVGIGASALSLGAIVGASILDQRVAPPHLERALETFNRAPPAGCEPHAPLPP